MSLTPGQLAARDGKITASFAPALMAGDEARILSEWMRLVEHPDYMPDDLSDKWAVQFGSWIEPFALDWHQRMTGRELSRRGEVVTHPTMPHVCCTLDAYRADDRMVIDCKAVGSYRKLDDVCGHYLPQIIVQRACVGAERGGLLIVHGGSEPKEYPLDIDPEYEAAVWERVGRFWRCVLDLTPPVALPAIVAPVAVVVEYDMSGNNRWPVEAAAWIAHRAASKLFAGAEKELKTLVPADAKRAFGAGIECVRDRAGRLSIKELRA